MTNIVPARLAYKCYTPSSGNEESSIPVIFLHGATLSKESFQDLPQIIADGAKRKVFALDARNHGDSEYNDIFNFDINVDDLFHFMDTMKIQKAALLGHSMGGITAINAALRKPERIEMIFVEDMYTKKVPKEELQQIVYYIELFSASVQSVPKELNYTEAVRYACDVFYSKLPPDTPDLPSKEVFCKHNFAFKRTTDGGYDLKFNRDVLSKAFKDAETIMSDPSGLYDGPAYFLYGTHSGFRVWEEEEHIKQYFPNAELVKFEGATHDAHMQFPEEFTKAVLQRLKP